MEGQVDSTKQEGGVLDNNKISTEDIVVAEASEGTVSELVQNSVPSTSEEQPASEGSTSVSAHRPEVDETSETDCTNIQGSDSHGVEERVTSQDSAENLPSLELDCAPDKGGGMMPRSDSSGHPENDMFVKPTDSRDSSCLDDKDNVPIDGKRRPATDPDHRSEQIRDRKDLMPSDQEKSDNATLELVPTKYTTETEGPNPGEYSVNSAEETDLGIDTTLIPQPKSSVSTKENVTLHTVPATDSVRDTATTAEVLESSVSDLADSAKLNSVQQSPAEQNMSVEESCEATASKVCAGQIIQSSKEDTASATEQVGGKNSVKGNTVGHDVCREENNKTSSSLQEESSQQPVNNQDKSINQQEENISTCKEGSEEHKVPGQSEDGKLNVTASGQNDLLMSEGETPMMYSEKDMTEEDLADISEFDSTVENVAENVTLNSATELEASEGQMDSLTFEMATEDGDPESSQSSLEAPTCHLDLGLPTLEMPLGENRISMYSDGDDSQQSLKKIRQEDELDKDEVSNGKDSIKDKTEEEKLESRCEGKEMEALSVDVLQASSTEGPNKDVNLNFETLSGVDSKAGQSLGEHFLTENLGDNKNGSCSSNAITPSDTNQNKSEMIVKSKIEESTLSSEDTSGPLDLTTTLNGAKDVSEHEATSTSRPYHGRSIWDAVKPTENIFPRKTEPAFQPNMAATEIIQFWKKTFQCKYCSFHAQSEADIKHHTQEKHTKKQVEQMGKELPWKKDLMETGDQVQNPAGQDQAFLNLVIPSVKKQEILPERNKGETEKEVHEAEKEASNEDKKAHAITEGAPKTEKEETGKYKCTHCSYQSNSIKGLCGHMAVHTKKVKCKKCDFVGKSVKDLQRHLLKAHRCSNSSILGTKKRSHVVRVTESSSKDLGKEALTHKARKSMPPSGSNVIFNNVESVTDQQDVDVSRVFVNHKTYPNGCTYCPYTTISMSELKAHMKHHQAVSGLPCTFCSYKAEDKPTLMSHIEVHYAGFAYKCNHCGFLSPTQEQALQHFESICENKPKHKTSSPSKKQRTKEASPRKGQKQKQQKDKNRKNKPDPSEKDESAQDMSGDASDDPDIITILQEPPKYSYQCPHCPFTVTGKAKLNVHIAGHSKEEGHQCTLCNFRVSSEAKLAKHLRVHQMIGRFKCKHCRFWSIYKDRVKQHLQTECKLKGNKKEGKSAVKVEQKETGNPWTSSVDETNSDIVSMVKDPNQYPHRCPHCPFSSASPTQIESHVAQHFREEGAQCDECTFWAISDGMLRKHKRVHQKLGKYKCKYCPYWSWYREKVQTHLEKCKLNPGRTTTEEETVEPDNTAKEKADNKAKRESYSRWDESEDEEIVVKVKKSLRTGHKCPHCPFVASNVGKLSIHLPNHDRTDGVKCTKCTFRAASEQLLGFHKRVHQRGVRTYHCVHCSFWSWYKDRVQKHLEKGCPQKKAENSSSNEEKNSGTRSKKESDTKSAKKEFDSDEEMSTSQVETDGHLVELTEDTSSSSSKPSVEMKGEEETAGEEKKEISENLDDHIIMIEQEAEPKYGLKCPHCPLTTASTDSYQQHLTRHEIKEGIQCDKCTFRALTTGRLQVHKKVHSRKCMYQCKHCVFSADSKSEVVQHLGRCAQKLKRDLEARDRKESDEVVVSRGIRHRQYSMNCPHCPYTTGNARCMKAHQQRHQNQDGIQCERCSFNAMSPGKMAKHMKVHQTGGGFKCKYCMFFSSYRSHVLQHLKLCRDRASKTKKEAKGDDEIGTSEEKGKDVSNTSESLLDGVEKDDIGPCSEIEVLKPDKTSNYKYNCPYCPHTALSQTSLEPHIQRHLVHDGPKCKFCTYRALSASGLYGHERLHWRGCFKCKYCGYLAPHRRRVLEHLEECAGRRILSVPAQNPKEADGTDKHDSPKDTNPVTQTEEGKGQKRKDPVEVSDRDVMIAYRKQTVKQHKCPHCPYSASGPALLEPHVVRHSDTGSGFKCDLCNYRAASFGWLNNHRRVHQDGYYFKCKYCAYWSTVKDEVLQHVARKHHMSSEDKKMKVEGTLSVEAAAVASQVTSNAGRVAAPSLMDTVKRLGEALRSSPVPMALDAQTKTDVSAVLLSPDKTAQEALKRKEGGDRNLVMTLKKMKTENGEAIWQTEESKVCPYNECKTSFESASAFVSHLAEHSGAAQTPNTSGQLPQPTKQPSVQSVQQLFLPQPSQPLPSQQPPSQLPPAKQLPSQLPPAKQLPSQQPPAKQLPSQLSPAKQLPSQLSPAKQLPSQQPPAKQLPSQQLPSQQPPLQQPPSQQPPLQQLPSQQPPSQQPPLQQLPSQQPPLQQLPSQQPPLQQLPSQRPPLQQLPSQQPPLQQPPSQQPPLQQLPSQRPPLQQLPSQWPPSQQPLPATQLSHPMLQQAGVAPLRHPALLQQQQLALFQPQQTLLQPPANPLTSLQLMPSNPTAPAGLVRPPQNISANQQAVLSQGQAVNPQNRQVFLVSGLQQNLGGFALFVPYTSGAQPSTQAASGSVVTTVVQSPHPTQASTVSQSTAGTPNLPLPQTQPAQLTSRPPDTEDKFDLSNHVTQTWRGDFLCKYCSYATQHCNIISRHVRRHLRLSGDKAEENAQGPQDSTGNSLQRTNSTPSSEGQSVGRLSVSPAYSSATTPPAHPNFNVSQHITEDWRTGALSCNYCQFSTTAKNILSRHVKKHLPQGAASGKGTPDNAGTPVGQQGAEGQEGPADASVAGSTEAFDLSKHATQTWRGDFTCNHCGYVAQFKQIMSRHVKQHLQSGKSPKPVVTCKDLTDHIRVMTVGQQSIYLCKYCDYQAAFKSHMSRHVKKHLALGIPPTDTTTQPGLPVSPTASAVQSQEEVSVLPETNSGSGGSRGASPGDPSSATSPPPDSNMTGVDVEGRWWTTKFRCKHCSFSTRYKHQIEEHMQTHSPAKAEQGQQVSPGTTQNKISTPPPEYSSLSPPVQTVLSSQSSSVVSSSSNAVISPASSTVTSPPPPAIVVSPPPLPSSPPSGLPATSGAQGTPGAVVDSSGKVSMTRRFVFYQCKFCQFTGHRKEEVIKHATEVHPGETPPLTNQGTPYKCPLCHYYTQSNAALQVHIKRHDNRDFPYICTHCKFAGASQADLEEHSRKHITMGRGSGRVRNVYFTTFKCPYCTFTSRVSTLMQGHLTTWHSTNAVFRFCFKCDLEFSNNEDMDRHMLLYHSGRAMHRYEMYKRESPTSASPAISSEGSQVDDSEPIPLLWKSSDRQTVKNVEEPLSLVTTDNRAEVGRSPLNLSQTDDSDVEFISETPATNSSTDAHTEQSEKEEDVTSRGGVSNDGKVVHSSQEKAAMETHAQEDSSLSIGREHTSPQARRIPSVSGPDDDDDVMASPPSSPDLKAVTDLMEELSDSEIISEDSTDPFGHHHSSQPETSPTKVSSATISGLSAEGSTAEKTSEEITNPDSGSLGKPNGEQDNTGTDKGDRDAEKSDTGGGGALMVSRVHPLQSGLVGSVEPASRSSLAGQQNWPALKSTSSDFQGSGSSTQSECAGTEVGRQVKGTALVACVSVSPQTNPSASGNSRSDSEAPSGAVTVGYRCNHCGVRFGDFLMYSIHGGFHHQENPFTCNICKHTATDRYQFNLHFTSAKHASLMDSSPLGAMAASLSVLSRGAAAPNTTPALPNGDQGYHCIHCSMTFDDFLLYSIHSGFHSQHHPFMCNICGQDCEDRFQFVMHFAKSDHS